jgi:ATP-dependent helicase/nuclease subunit B
MPVELVFSGWNGSFVDSAAGYLEGLATGPLTDLGGVLVLVPTREAGRRLRQTLAARAAGHGRALLSGPVMTPGGFLGWLDGPGVAGHAQQMAAWTKALLEADEEALLPLLPQGRQGDPAAVLTLARRLVKVAEAISEGPFQFGDLVPRIAELGGDFAELEASRWQALELLHGAARASLQEAGLADSLDARCASVAAPRVQEGVKTVVLAGICDLPGSLRQILDALAQRLDLKVLVNAPSELASHFDPWGIPDEDYWPTQPIPLDETQVRALESPAAEARAVLDLLRANPEGPALCVLSPETKACLLSTGALEGFSFLDPGGAPLDRHQLALLLTLARDYRREGSCQSLLALVAHPAMQRLLAPRLGDPFAFLGALHDKVRQEAPLFGVADLVHRLPDSHNLPALKALVEAVNQLLAPLAEQFNAATLAGFFRQAYKGCTWSPENPGDRSFLAAAEKLMDSAADQERGPAAALPEAAGRGLDFFLATLEGRSYDEDGTEDSIPMLGILELPFEAAGQLLILGASDASLPSCVRGDPFLPDRARAHLGLAHNLRRLARDAFIVRAAVEQRLATGGAVQFSFGAFSQGGQPQRPSPLFFLTEDEALGARVLRLFAPPPKPPAPPASQPGAGLRLRAPAGTYGRPLSASAIRDYLTSPFLFYLKHVAGLRPPAPCDLELTPLSFGNILHGLVEGLEGETSLLDCEDPQPFADYLNGQLDATAAGLYGGDIPGLVGLQFESMRVRLQHLAQVLADSRREGWRLLHTEKDFELELDLEGQKVPVKGRMDWLERHTSGVYRVLDLKTGDNAKDPAAAHLVTASPDADPDLTVPLGRSLKVFADLQLPLYAMAQFQATGALPQVGYLCLPAAVTETRLALLEDYEALHPVALRTLARVHRDITSGRFWPPGRWQFTDEFGRFLAGNPAAVVAFEALEGGAR